MSYRTLGLALLTTDTTFRVDENGFHARSPLSEQLPCSQRKGFGRRLILTLQIASFHLVK
jgi:hypothetical protein